MNSLIFSWTKLLSQVQLNQNRSVPADVFAVKVIKESTTLADEFQQTHAGGEILLVRFEVFRQRVDAVREQSNL